MLRKFATILVGLLIFTMMLPVFANDSDKAFEVVEPTFGKNNEVIAKNLLINIRIYEEIPLEMTLVRVEPNITDAVLRDEISTLEGTAKRMMPILPSEDAEAIDVSDVDIPFSIQSEYEQDERRKIVKVYLETLHEKQSADEEFIRAYSKYNDLFYSEDLKQIVVNKELSYYEQEMITEYKNALEKMVKTNYIYNELSPIYNSLFETVVVGPENIQLDGVIPFYRTAVEDIKPGEYKLIFKTNNKVLEVREFTVKKLEEDKIKENTTNILKNVLNENDEAK